MGAKVTGQAVLFLGTACGPALTTEQRDFLKKVNPDEWYPVEKMMEVLQTAKDKDINLLKAAGKSWGQVIKQRLAAEGIDNPKDALAAVCSVYKRDHTGGEVGDLVPEIPEGDAFVIHDTSIYPSEMLAGVWEALTVAYGAYDSIVAVSDVEGRGARYDIQWKMKS